MRHAYLILAHNNFSTLKKLLQMLDNENNNIFILIDKKNKEFNEKEYVKINKKAYLSFVPRINVYWAGFSQIKATLILLEEALKIKCDYYHFISGNDFPIKTQEYIYTYFMNNRGYEFIDYNPKHYEFAKYKANYYHLFVENNYFRTSKIIKILNHSLAKIQQKIGFIRENEKLFHGSQWFSITNECATYILSKKELIYSRYKYTLACDEVFLQTLIWNSPFKEKVRYIEEGNISNARLIDWNRISGNSPYTFKAEDYEQLINADERLLFARKFDEKVDDQIIESIFSYLKKENKKSEEIG